MNSIKEKTKPTKKKTFHRMTNFLFVWESH